MPVRNTLNLRMSAQTKAERLAEIFGAKVFVRKDKGKVRRNVSRDCNQQGQVVSESFALPTLSDSTSALAARSAVSPGENMSRYYYRPAGAKKQKKTSNRGGRGERGGGSWGMRKSWKKHNWRR